MMGIELIGWVATLLLLVGYYFNAQKKLISWVLWMVGNSTMLAYAILIDSYSVAFLSFVLVLLNVYGYFSWKR